MRFDSKIKFWYAKSGYDPTTGKYESGKELVHEDTANVTDMGTDRSANLLGNYTKNAKVIRFLHSIPVMAFDYLTINDGDACYRLNTQREPLKGRTMIVGEDIGN